jgi:hypothetical protein
METEQTQTNMKLTEEERQILREASGEPYNHGAIVGGVRRLIADWVSRGRPELEREEEAQ